MRPLSFGLVSLTFQTHQTPLNLSQSREEVVVFTVYIYCVLVREESVKAVVLKKIGSSPTESFPSSFRHLTRLAW